MVRLETEKQFCNFAFSFFKNSIFSKPLKPFKKAKLTFFFLSMPTSAYSVEVTTEKVS